MNRFASILFQLSNEMISGPRRHITSSSKSNQVKYDGPGYSVYHISSTNCYIYGRWDEWNYENWVKGWMCLCCARPYVPHDFNRFQTEWFQGPGVIQHQVQSRSRWNMTARGTPSIITVLLTVTYIVEQFGWSHDAVLLTIWQDEWCVRL